MNEWAREAETIARSLAGHPPGNGEFWSLVAVSFLTMLIMFRVAGKAVHNDGAELWSNLFLLVVGGALVMAAAVAGRLYLIPELGLEHDYDRWILIGCAVAATLAVVIPLICLVQRTKYLSALVMVFVSIVVAGLAALLVRGAFDAGRQGEEDTAAMRVHKKAIDEVTQP